MLIVVKNDPKRKFWLIFQFSSLSLDPLPSSYNKYPVPVGLYHLFIPEETDLEEGRNSVSPSGFLVGWYYIPDQENKKRKAG